MAMTNKYVITFSYGDCSRGAGGTDKAILAQIRLLNSAGYAVFSLSPHTGKRNNYWDVLLNGKIFGVFSTNRFKGYISSLKNCTFCSICIHHLKNIEIKELESIIDFINIPIVFYLHDYYTICPIGGLVREDGTYCGSGFPQTNKCGDCSFFTKSSTILIEYKEFLHRYNTRLNFIIPSEIAKDIWLQHYSEYKNQIRVVYHQELIGIYLGNRTAVTDTEPLKVAFIGYQFPLKGWKSFKHAATNAMISNCNIKFYQFGWGEDRVNGINQVVVDFKSNMNAMIDELRKKEIHVAVLWSLWPETYAYTYYEALAANCFVITNENSGNICAQVKARNNGIVVSDLSEILCNESKLRKLVNGFRANEHVAPKCLKESEAFFSLIQDTDWKPKEIRKVVDYSNVLTILKKSKRVIKDWIKKV